MTREAHPFTGRPIPRTEAGLKVSGAITYAGDVVLPGLLHAVLVPSPIARGTIRSADTTAAAAVPGVVRVFTPGTMPRLVSPPEQPDWDIMYGSAFVPMADATIHYAGQPIGLVLAETLEAARHAAAIVRYAFDEDVPCVGLEGDADLSGEAWHEPEQVWLGFLAGHLPGAVRRGDAAAALSHAEVTIEGRWTLAYNHHNPMEPAASVAVWEDGDRLTLYETSQHVANPRATGAGAWACRARTSGWWLLTGGGGCRRSLVHSLLAAWQPGSRPAARLGQPRADVHRSASAGTRIDRRSARRARSTAASASSLATPAWEDWVEPRYPPPSCITAALETRCRG